MEYPGTTTALELTPPIILALLAISCALSIALYRATFHPLARYPGPLLGKFTDWYSVYHAWKGDRHIDFHKLHHQYGDVVRYGPNRISINTNTALHEIYGVRSNVQKAKFYNAFSSFFSVPSTITFIDKAQHGFRRRIINQALAVSALKGMERLMLDNIRKFCDQLVDTEPQDAAELPSREWSTCKNMTDWFARLTFDIVGDLSFGRNWNVVDSERNRSFLKNIPAGTAGLLLAGHMPAILTLRIDRIFFRRLTDSARHFEDMAKWQTKRRLDASQDDGAVHDDIFAKLIEARDSKTGIGLSTTDLNAEAIVLIVAGSDTMATTMTATLFYLLHYPSTLDRLHREINGTFPSLEDIVIGPQLTSCTYLRACLDEALRLNPPLGGVLPREVLHGGITIDGDFFPAGTDIGTPLYALQRQEKYFRHASRFEPQRWLVEKTDPGSTAYGDAALAQSAFGPFSLGPRRCPGKEMAYVEMMLALARIVFVFEMRLDGESLDIEGNSARGSIQFQTRDNFVSQHDGPLVQFKRRCKLESNGD